MAEECPDCVCECGHGHPANPTLIGGARCICCKWCMCQRHRVPQPTTEEDQ